MLRVEQGKIGERLMKLYDKGTPKEIDLAKAIQIPNKVFSGLYPYLVRAWEIGMKKVCKEAKVEPFEKPLPIFEQELRKLAKVFEGSEYIAGEGELLERRLYSVLMGVSDKNTAYEKFINEMEKYIVTVLPERVADPIHQATQIGIRDAIEQLRLLRLKELKKGE